MMSVMPQIRISEAAGLLGVSDDTVRRWAASGELTAVSDDQGRQAIEGRELAEFVVRRQRAERETHSSARNRLVGLVTAVERDTVMAQVELRCGPFRLVSLMSREAVDDLGLEVGSVAAAVVKATTVIVEREDARR